MTSKTPPEENPAAGVRLQKVLAAAGLGSRRDCEELITQGRVEVDRQFVTELGTRVHPEQQEIRVDGEALRQPKRLYFAVNKPLGVVTTNFDPSGRARVIDLVPTEERVFAVGRLDRSSEGLILLTNDGEFANRLTHPRYGVEKTYLVRVAGAPTTQELDKLKKGVHLAEGFAKAQSIAVKKSHGRSTDMVIVLNEGRNREIRRILARVGHKVLLLKRVAVGSVKLGDLPVGAWRKLMPNEIEELLKLSRVKRSS
jgi:23S rRNA pseudouridine2605 synthase